MRLAQIIRVFVEAMASACRRRQGHLELGRVAPAVAEWDRPAAS